MLPLMLTAGHSILIIFEIDLNNAAKTASRIYDSVLPALLIVSNHDEPYYWLFLKDPEMR